MKQTKVSLPDDLREWIAQRAAKELRSESSIIREAIYLYRLNKEKAA